MLEKNDLLALGQMMDDLLDRKLDELFDRKLEPVYTRLDAIEARLTNLEEDSKVTRESVNTLLAWAEEAQVQVQIPLFRKAE